MQGCSTTLGPDSMAELILMQMQAVPDKARKGKGIEEQQCVVMRDCAARAKVRSVDWVWQEKSCRAATAPVENQLAGMFTRTPLRGEALKPSLCHYSRDQRESAGVGGRIVARRDSPVLSQRLQENFTYEIIPQKSNVSWAAQRGKFDLNPWIGGHSGFGPTQSE